ncbi:MAG: hypothetical protein ACQETB_12645 [Halobacteriota archaeon]
MAKVSVGLRGWRFEESEIFTDEGEFKPLEEIPKDPRQRLIRLATLIEKPCDACYLTYGDEQIQRCRPAAIVYGEPMSEVLLCAEHEPDFHYWYQEAGGSQHRGEETFADEFHEWFAAGNRAPESYGAVDHVDTDPESLPEPPGPDEIQARLEAEYEPTRIDLRSYGSDAKGADEAGERLSEDDLEGLDLGTEYPKQDE